VTNNDWPGSISAGSSVLDDVDFLNIMIYDMGNPHSPYSAAVNAIPIWCEQKGLAKEKFMLGVPFYSNNPDVLTYAQIVAQNPDAATQDNVGGYDYNGLPTITQKTNLALEQAGGIMIWEIGQDAGGSALLLSAIYELAKDAITPTAPLAIKPTMAASPRITAQGRTIVLRLPVAGAYNVTAYTSAGKVAFTHETPFSSGEYRIKLPAATAPGLYVLKCGSNAFSSVGSIILP
jgi:hypothetical protein